MSIEAMKQALESLEVLLRDYGAVHDAGDLEMQPTFHQAHVAIEKLRQAIEQAEQIVPSDYSNSHQQEPVAWAEITKDYVAVSDETFENAIPLYTAPVHASDISQERVDETEKDKHEFECPRCGHCCQQRKWVGLTDDEIYDYADKFLYTHGSNYEIKSFGKAIEAKLKEKNT
jgi:heterodisulfide reductase subunit B